MKLLHFILAGFVISFACLAHAQSFSVEWFTIDSGGGANAVSNYSLTGTIGQPDAGPTLTTGAFSLVGGFWSASTVQNAVTPVLNLVFTSPGALRIAWPSSLAGYGIQQTTSLSTPNWTAPPETINDDGINKFIIVHPATGNRFFRLMHP
jgi:hypothetical protein